MDEPLGELEYSNSPISLKQKCLYPSFLAMSYLSTEQSRFMPCRDTYPLTFPQGSEVNLRLGEMPWLTCVLSDLVVRILGRRMRQAYMSF